MKTETRSETYEWGVEICDNCGHEIGNHYNKAKKIYDTKGKYMYTAVGCMVLSGKRKLPGDNPYLRCECMKGV